jgi:hypothetical protein
MKMAVHIMYWKKKPAQERVGYVSASVSYRWLKGEEEGQNEAKCWNKLQMVIETERRSACMCLQTKAAKLKLNMQAWACFPSRCRLPHERVRRSAKG